MEFNENDLKLTIQEKNLGSLTTNALAIKEKVKSLLPKYDKNNYSEENIDKAKKDKALLNNTGKLLNEERKNLEKEFMLPFEEFKTTIKETIELIDEASKSIDTIVKEVESKEKNKKKDQIIEIFDKNVEELKLILPLEKIFNERWLNKGVALSTIDSEICTKLSQIRRDLSAISELHSKYEIELKNDYLNDFDLGKVIIKNNDLMKKEELLKNQEEETKKVIEVKKEEKLNAMANEKISTSLDDSEFTYVLKIKGSRTQLEALKKFLITNEFEYEKVG